MKISGPLAIFIQAAPRHSTGIEAFLRHLGGVGVFILAIIDSTPIPTFAGPDILTAVLSARRHEPWYYYTLLAAAGSAIGAFITYHMARKAGMDYLNRRFGKHGVDHLLEFFQKWGTGALIVSTMLPLPFPTSLFFAVAGLLDYPIQLLVSIVLLCRGLRYGVIAVTAAHYGRRFIVSLRHPQQHWGWLISIALVVIAATAASVTLTRWIQSRRTTVSGHTA